MIIFNHPQPALLFLVPTVTGGLFIKAVLDKNLTPILEYDEKDLKEQKSVE